MKLTAFMLFVAVLSLQAKSKGQTVSVSGKNLTLKQVFSAIKKQTGYVVFGREELISKAKPVKVEANQVELKVLLKQILEPQGLDFEIKEKTQTIVLIENSPARSTDYMGSGVKQLDGFLLISARVIGSDGQVLADATVRIKGKQMAVSTNANGQFNINADRTDSLVISYTGYIEKNVAVSALLSYTDIVLTRSDNPLDDIQVIAYGSTSRRLNTGAVSSVKAETIERQPVGNVMLALSGQVPGLDIVQRTGTPGGAVRFNIRGFNSLNGENDPFIIIDGVPFNTSVIQVGGNILAPYGHASPLNSINPADIESIEILKDADATAIYGSRGANGVILITTKKSKTGKTGLDVNIYHGIGKVSRRSDLLNTREYLDMRYKAFANDNVDWRASNVIANDLKRWDTTRYTDWQKVLVGGTAAYTNASATLTGGNQYTTFSVGGTYWKETMVYPGSFSDQKISGRLGVSHRSANGKFRMELSAFYLGNDNLLPNANVINTAITLAPNAPRLYHEDGTFNWENGTFDNPMAMLAQTQEIKSKNLNSSGLFSFILTRGLWLRTNIGYSNVAHNANSFTPQRSLNPFGSAVSEALYRQINNSSWNLEPYLDYETTLGKGKLSALLGTTIQDQKSLTTAYVGNSFLDDNLMRNPAAAASGYFAPAIISDYRYNAIFGRLNYNVQNKYIANLTMRRDGSSRFGPGKQFGNFGAIGMSWIFSEERFIKERLPFLNFGKLRTSYGVTGSDAIGNYNFLSTYSVTTWPTANYSSLSPDRLFNPDYGWESNRKLDLALELGLAKDRIFLTANFYRNISSNQLVGVPLPSMVGFPSITGNLNATVRNSGWEFLLHAVHAKTNLFTWESKLNITIPRNKLMEYPNLESSPNATRYAVGFPITLEKTYRYVGVNPATGVNIYKDRNGKDTSFISSNFFTNEDRTAMINTGPDLFGGLSTAVTYKGFSLDVMLQFTRRYKIDEFQSSFSSQPAGYPLNIPVYVYYNSWMNAGDEARFQRFTQRTSSAAYRSRATSSTEQYFMKTWLLRLNNASVSYSLPQSIRQKLHASSLRIYMLGQNLFTISNYKGLNPEGGGLPRMRVITAGIQAQF